MRSTLYLGCIFLLLIVAKNFQLRNNNANISQEVTCMKYQDSQYATTQSCNSEHPLPFKVHVTFKLLKNVTWQGQSDWFFVLRDINGDWHNFDKNSCITSQSPAGSKKAGEVLSVAFTCYKSPKQLAYGDIAVVKVLSYDRPFSAIMGIAVPLPGYSTEVMSQKLSFKSDNLKK